MQLQDNKKKVISVEKLHFPTGEALICCFYVPLLTDYSEVKMLHCSNTLQLG